MRILLIHDWNPGRGGSEAYVGWLHDQLLARGHQVHLLTGDAGSAGDGRAASIARAGRSLPARAVYQIFNPDAWRQARRAARDFSPDVVHLHHHAYQLSGSVALALRHLPIVASIHDYKNVCPLGTKALPDGRICTQPHGIACLQGCLGPGHWLRDQVRYQVLDSALRKSRRRIVYSRHIQSVLQQHGIEAELHDYAVCQPTDSFQRRPAPDPLFVYLGRLEPEKGVATLLTAFARLHATHPEARLRIVGDGSQRRPLEQLCQQLSLDSQVDFKGWQPAERLNEWLSDAWCAVAPSLMAEPFGFVAPECILRGIPVIASRIGGFADSVSHGKTGLLFDNGNVEGLLQCLLEFVSRNTFPDLICDPEATSTLRQLLHPDRHLSRLESVYRDLSHDSHQGSTST